MYRLQELIGSLIVIVLTWMHYVRQTESNKIKSKQHKIDLVFCVVLGYIFYGMFSDILVNYFKITKSDYWFDYKLIGVAWFASIMAIEVYYRILLLIPKTVEVVLSILMTAIQAALKKAVKVGDNNESDNQENPD